MVSWFFSFILPLLLLLFLFFPFYYLFFYQDFFLLLCQRKNFSFRLARNGRQHSVCRFVCLVFRLCLSVCRFVCLSVCLSLSLSLLRFADVAEIVIVVAGVDAVFRKLLAGHSFAILDSGHQSTTFARNNHHSIRLSMETTRKPRRICQVFLIE